MGIERLVRFGADDSGATSTEYALIAGIVSIATVGALALFGVPLETLYTSIAGGVSSAADASGG